MLGSAIAVLLIGAMSPAASGTPSQAELAREEAVYAAVVRQQIREHLDPSERARGTVLCVAVDPGDAPQSPSRSLMAQLADEPQSFGSVGRGREYVVFARYRE